MSWCTREGDRHFAILQLPVMELASVTWYSRLDGAQLVNIDNAMLALRR